MASTELQEQQLLESYQRQVDSDTLKLFLENSDALFNSGKQEYLALSISIPSVDVLAIIEQTERTAFQYYWEKPNDEFAIAAAGNLETVNASGEERFRTSSKHGKEILQQVHHFSGVAHRNAVVHLLGGFSFFDEKTSGVWEPFHSASFTLPEWIVVREGSCTILTLIVKIQKEDSFCQLEKRISERLISLSYICDAEKYQLTGKPKKPIYVKQPGVSSKEYLQWVDMVKKAKSGIDNSEFKKVVLAREFKINLEEKISDTRILNRLRSQYPDCYCFLIRQNDEASFIGCTPERLASFSTKFVLTEGLAGSTSRGKTASEDAVLEYNLLHSSKDRHEHDIVLEAIEENLMNYSDEVSHPKAPQVKKLSNVQHLYTPVTAKIKNGVSRTEVLKTLHPTPAVGGFPRENAVEFIKAHEDFDRGWYASPFGWINAHGEGEFVVAIRSGLITDNEVRFFAGCGIVEDSDPHKEWEETNLKFIPMLSALEYAGT